MELENTYTVYIKTDSNGYITEINSSAFLADTTGWTKIDRGYGDKFHHAQGNYFPEPIMTVNGACRYKLADTGPVECAVEEIRAQESTCCLPGKISDAERIVRLEEQNTLLEQCILEMSEIVYA